MEQLDDFLRNVIRDRVEALDAALTTFVEHRDDTELRTLANSLRGAGASFGLPEISQLADVVVRAGGAELQDAVTRLRSALERASGGGARKTVLLVDDDPLIGSLLEMRLAGLDRRVIRAPGVAQARSLIVDAGPDVIVLDLVLEDGDGRTLLSELKSSPRTAAIPVVMMSGSDAPGLRDHCLALGASAFLTKPFDTDSAVHLIAGFLSGSNDGPDNELVVAYDRAVAAIGSEMTLATIIPESHGFGGPDQTGVDERIVAEVKTILDLFLPEGGRCVRSGSAEFTIVTPASVDETAERLDRARFRLRTRRHPVLPDAMMTFSAGVARNEAGTDLAGTLSQARTLASGASRSGGDRVCTEIRGGGGRRVLLAEDDALTAALVIKRLQREGYDVEHRPNGAQALEALREHRFSLVVLDVNMPESDGFEVLRSIRSTSSERVPVVMLTSAGSESDVVRGFELGADDYILKPFSPAELGARLRRFTRRI